MIAPGLAQVPEQAGHDQRAPRAGSRAAHARSARADGSHGRNAEPRRSAGPGRRRSTSLGSEPPRFGSTTGVRPVVRSIERRGKGDPAVLGVGAGRAHHQRLGASATSTAGRPGRVERIADRRQEGSRARRRRCSGSGSGAEARGGMALTGWSGIAGGPGEDLEAAPAEHLFGRGQARLAPVRVDRGLALGERPSAGRRSASARATAAGSARGFSSGIRIAPVLRDDGRDRMREQDCRIGQKAAPVARMMGGFPELDHQIEVERAAAAEEDGRLVGRKARPVGAEQEVGRTAAPDGSRRSRAARASRSPRWSRSAPWR